MVAAGKVVIKFSADPNFVIVTPRATSDSGKMEHLQSWQREITFGDTTSIIPAEVKHGTSYVPIWYAMQTLITAGVASKWNSRVWSMTTSQSVDLSRLPSSHGSAYIFLNGHAVQYLAGLPGKDPSLGHATTFMPIWCVMQVLNRLDVHSTWDGTARTLVK
jgi:hypothetical protein